MNYHYEVDLRLDFLSEEFFSKPFRNHYP